MNGLRWWRRARGLTQEALAIRSGVERSHIGKLERGEVEEPRPSTLLRLADALGVEVIELLYGEHSVGIFGPPEDLVRQALRDHTATAPLRANNAHEAPTNHPKTTPGGRA